MKWIFRYLVDTYDCDIMFDKNGTSNIAMGYMDFNYVEDLDSTMSMIGHVFTFGGDYICWKSNWHNIVAPCTT